MAWQPTTDLDPLQPGERGFHDPASGRYAIVRLLEAPVPNGKESEVYALRPSVREVDADGQPVMKKGVAVRLWRKTFTAYLARMGDPDAWDSRIVEGLLGDLDARREALAVTGRYPSVEDA